MLWSMSHCVGKNHRYHPIRKHAAREAAEGDRGLFGPVGEMSQVPVDNGYTHILDYAPTRCDKCPAVLPKSVRAMMFVQGVE
jgi:hypothetical protein